MLIGQQRKGFTIVELLIVIVIIAILAVITIVTFSGVSTRAKISELKSDLTQATKQLLIDRVIEGSQFPATLAVANQGKGIRASLGDTFQYTADNTTNPSAFCLSVTNGSLAYHTAQDGITSEGVCSGHTAPAGSGGSTTYAIGATGPAGGVVFYDKGNSTGGWQYLEAGPAEAGYATWGCDGTVIAGADNNGIGAGKQNTADILNGCSDPSSAAKVATNYSAGGFHDWFLPSKDELDQLYQHRAILQSPPVAGNIYWSSTEAYNNSGIAYMNNFAGVSSENSKSSASIVRAIRSF